MPVSILTVAQMRSWEEATWKTGTSSASVIENVGRQLAQRIQELTRPGDRILLLAGKGHNGDDTRAVAPHLAGRKVDLLNVEEAAQGLETLQGPDKKEFSLVVDGLFGIGLNRPLVGDWIRLIEYINSRQWRVLSVDVPSGLNADSGAPEGIAIRAAITCTIGAPKSGLVTARQNQSQNYVGRLEVLENVGLIQQRLPITELQWLREADFREFPPPRSVSANKGTFGHVALIAGSRGYHGAAVLASLAAERAQPGLVTLLCSEPVYFPVAAHLKGTMVRPLEIPFNLPKNTTALVTGPGMADPNLEPGIADELRRLWVEARFPIVVDASALDWLETGSVQTDSPRVVTPHPGEAARLLKTTVAEIQSNRMEAVREISRSFGGCTVVLKGHQTLIGNLKGPIYVNSSGNPSMAKGGTGDILAGLIGGMLAQAGNDEPTAQAWIHYAVWRHGKAADDLILKKPNWIVEELLEILGEDFARVESP